MRAARPALALLLGSALITLPATAEATAAGDPTTERVSVTTDGSQANSHSTMSSLSANGRFVAFMSRADNLVADDTNGQQFEVFVRDRQNGTTERVSVPNGGGQANSQSGSPSISGDGRFVAFWSSADNLVTGDTNSANDVFVRDRLNGTTERVDVATGGAQSGGAVGDVAISADGRYVAFTSSAADLVSGDSNGVTDVFVHDRQTGTTSLVSADDLGDEGNLASSSAAISGDGRYVAFLSAASDLVTGDTNSAQDVFVRDLVSGTTERVSLASSGAQQSAGSDVFAPSLSADGRYVAFGSNASNLVPGDDNFGVDAFVRDRQAGTTVRVSVASNGSQGDQGGYDPTLSADGQRVVFTSSSSTLASGDTNGKEDIFVHDLGSGLTGRVSVANDGGQGNGDSNEPAVSGDGSTISFKSLSTNLVTGDTNGSLDVFTRQQGSLTGDNTPPVLSLPAPMSVEATSADGAQATFSATATDDTDPSPEVSCTPASGSSFPLGKTTVSCSATDAAGNTSTGTFDITVADTTGPTVSVASPHAGDSVSGQVTVSANAADAVGVRGVQLLVDGVELWQGTASPYEATWDTDEVSAGDHTIVAKAIDDTNHITVSDPVTVKVDHGVSSSDKLVWHEQVSDSLWIGAPGGPAPTKLVSGHATSPAWSPDRTNVVFSGDSDGNWDIWTVDVGTKALVNLTDDESVNDRPAWSPDGARIAFASNRDGDYEIYTMKADGTDLRQVTHNTRFDSQPAWSPDGTWLVYSGAQDLRTVRPDGTGELSVTTTPGLEEDPTWSPDGKLIAFTGSATGGAEIFTIKPDGTDRHQLTDDPSTAFYPTWSPDGTAIAFSSLRSGDYEVWAMRADGSGLRNVSRSSGIDLDPDWGQAPVAADTTAPTLSLPANKTVEATGPGGATVTYAASANDETDPSPVVTCTPASGTGFPLGKTTVTCSAKDAAGNIGTGQFDVTVADTIGPAVTLTAPAAGAVTGTVALTADATDAVGVAGVRFEVDGSPVGTEDVAAPYTRSWNTDATTAGEHTLVAIARDAAGNETRSAAVTVVVDKGLTSEHALVWYSDSGAGALWMGAPGGPAPTKLYSGEALQPTWSPDRTKVAFAAKRDGNWDIWIIDVATRVLTNVTNDSFTNSTPAWSPDGARIAFSSDRDGDAEIWTIRPDGTGRTQVTSNRTFDDAPAWSPDGQRLVYSAGTDLALISPDGSGRTALTSTSGIEENASWSPDGSKIAFDATAPGGAEVFTVRPDGTGRTQVTDDPTVAVYPTWSPDGTALGYASQRSGNYEIWAVRTDGTGLRNVSGLAGSRDLAPDWGQTKQDADPVLEVCGDYGIPGSCTLTVHLANPNPGPMPGGTVKVATGTGSTGVTLSPTSHSDGATCQAVTGWITCSVGTVPAGGRTITLDVFPNGTQPWQPRVVWDCGCTTTGPRTWTGTSVTAHGVCVGGQVLFDTDASLPLLDVFAATLGGQVHELSASSGNEEAGAVWAPDHRSFAMHVGLPTRRQIVVVTLDSNGCIDGQRVVPNQPAGDNYQADWSPDGKSLAFISDATGNDDIWRINVNGKGLLRLTTSPADDRAPSFSADGKRVAFASNRTPTRNGTDWNIWTTDTAGNHNEKFLSTAATGYQPGKADYSPSYSRKPGSSSILWHTNSGGNWDLWVMKGDGSGKHRVPHATVAAEKNADWAQNDTRIVYDAGPDAGPADIWMMWADGTHRHLVASTPGDDKAPSL